MVAWVKGWAVIQAPAYLARLAILRTREPGIFCQRSKCFLKLVDRDKSFASGGIELPNVFHLLGSGEECDGFGTSLNTNGIIGGVDGAGLGELG